MNRAHRAMMLAAALALLPASALMAQTTAPATGDGSRLGGQTGAPTRPSPSGVTASQNSNVPGATGKTVVPGTNSTVSGDTSGTALGKTGSIPGQSGGGPGGK